MAARQSVPPLFAPGSGWYRPGQWSPGSDRDRAAKLEAAVPCTVIVLRRRGMRIPAAELLRTEPPSGFLVCQDLYTAPRWYACFFRDKTMRDEALPRLLHVELERENAGVRLYGGIDLDGPLRQEWRQAWLCTPTPERAREILLEMLARQGGGV